MILLVHFMIIRITQHFILLPIAQYFIGQYLVEDLNLLNLIHHSIQFQFHHLHLFPLHKSIINYLAEFKI